MGAAVSSSTFEAAATRVLLRVTLRRWLALASQTLPWAVAAMAVVVVLQWTGLVGPWAVFVVIALWLGGAAGWAWRHQPGKYEALALWDHAGHRSEAFAAAWWYGRQHELSPMQRRHVEIQSAVLNDALIRLQGDLPLPLNRRLWVAPLMACLGLLGGVFQPQGMREQPLSDAMKQAALKESRDLTQTGWQKKKLQGLTEQEKKAVEKLKQDINSTAGDLQAAGSKSAHDVLNDLEKRAREAEKLAQHLGSDSDAWASEKLVSEMRKHADTADLGDAAANQSAAQTAKAATDLAARLRAPTLPPEVRDRVSEALKEIKKQAEPLDHKRTVGSHVIAAGDEMELGKTVEAAQEFESLATAMQELARREQARKELERLAQQLRDAGSRIAGSQGGGMKPMAGAAQSGAPGQQDQVAQSGQQMLNQQSISQEPLAQPGLAQPPLLQQAPESATSQQQMTMAQGQPGQSSSQGKPMLLAPIPGAKSDQPPSAIVSGPDAPKDDPKGPAFAISAPGGQQAGNATAKLGAGQIAPQKAKQNAQVNAAQGGAGPSSSRRVEGGTRPEAAARSDQQISIDFIKQQEEALDEAALPPARREQVRRYFTELRKRFEAAEK